MQEMQWSIMYNRETRKGELYHLDSTNCTYSKKFQSSLISTFVQSVKKQK